MSPPVDVPWSIYVAYLFGQVRDRTSCKHLHLDVKFAGS